jgi:hypothetical protein
MAVVAWAVDGLQNHDTAAIGVNWRYAQRAFKQLE